MGRSSKDKRDLYYRKAKEQGFRARSAFKLQQLDDEFCLLDGVERVVDLCAAPGSWSQVLSRRLFPDELESEDSNTTALVDLSAAASMGELSIKDTFDTNVNTVQNSGSASSNMLSESTEVADPLYSSSYSGKCNSSRKIVAVDLQPISPIPHVTTLQADITHPRTLSRILTLFSGQQADLVVSDGAPDVTGLHDLDEYIQQQLILSALQLTTCLLRPGGSFVAKIFRGRDIDMLYSQLGYLFDKVICAKPRSSRGSSLESFIVCQGYNPPKDWTPSLDLNESVEEFFKDCISHSTRSIAEFIACGSLDSFDSDATYNDLDDNQPVLSPVQLPKNPPYKRALQLKREGKLHKTK